jgi:hypothetical protein
LILSSSGTAIQAFDQARWAETGRYNSIDLAASLNLFRTLREANLSLFKLLSAEEWSRFGLHAERGKETLRDIARYYAGHDFNHFSQIESILTTVVRLTATISGPPYDIDDSRSIYWAASAASGVRQLPVSGVKKL